MSTGNYKESKRFHLINIFNHLFTKCYFLGPHKLSFVKLDLCSGAYKGCKMKQKIK